MEQNETLNRVLLVTDVSNFEYVCIWAAFTDWQKNNPEDAAFLLPADETDQDNLPDLLSINSFKRSLYKVVQKKLESLRYIAKNNHQTELDMADGLDVVFTEDDRIHNNFRRLLYPEYKAQRKLVKKQYDVFKIKNYIQDVIFKELELESKHGYKMIKVEDCESDDIIAVLMKRFDNYMCRILISSDRDFLQLENVNQYDMWGHRIERGLKIKDEFIPMSKKDFLLWKIIRGDAADNIKNVFSGFGEIKSYKLTQDRKKLREMLVENMASAQRFKMNKTLIDFDSIPADVEEKIYLKLKELLKTEEKKDNFDLEECIDL